MADEEDITSKFARMISNSGQFKDFAAYISDVAIPHLAVAERLGVEVTAIPWDTLDKDFIKQCVADFQKVHGRDKPHDVSGSDTQAESGASVEQCRVPER